MGTTPPSYAGQRGTRTSSRPGGTPFRRDDALFLPVQDCSRTYGGAIRLLRIDALADHATHEEFETIAERHNMNLFVLGVAVTLLGALPTFVWVGSVLGLALLPVTAILSVLTFTALFTYCGLAYSLYCLQALQDLRQEQGADGAQPLPSAPVKPITPISTSVSTSEHNVANGIVENSTTQEPKL